MLESGVISDIALIFVTDEDFDSQINRALALVGNRLDMSRCALFFDSPDGATLSNTHEWCAEGVESAMHLTQNEPRLWPSVWDEMLEDKDVFVIEDVRSLPAGARDSFVRAGVVSGILAPIRIEGQLRGTVNFHECSRPRTWNASEMETLKTISGIITTACSKRILAEELSASEENFRSFFHSLDEIIVVTDLEARIVFANEGAIRTMGFPSEEYLGKSVLEFLPPDERDVGGRKIAAMLRGKIDRSLLDAMTKDGVRIPLDVRIWFGKWDGQDRVFGLARNLSKEQGALRRFETLFRTNPAIMAIVTADARRFVDVNDSFLETLGYTREQVIGASSQEIGVFFGDARWARARAALRRDGFIRNHELALRRKDGSLVQGLFSGAYVEVEGQSHLIIVMVDITEQVKLRRDLIIERNRLSNILEGTKLGTWEWNVQTGDTIFNERWAEIIGYTLAELAPTNIETWTRLVHPDDLAESERLLREHFEGNTDFYEYEHRMRHKNGEWIWVLDRGKVIERDPVGRPFRMYGTHMDITDKKTMAEQIRELSIRDSLTDLYNRRHIFARVDEMVAEYSRYGRNFCISILDIDHFKQVNDTFGHQVGDHILREFTQTIGSMIRQYDLLGRYGGEEFILVSANAKATDTVSMIERFMEVMRGRVFGFGEHELRLTFSCGLAGSSEFPRMGFSSEAIVALADQRLYMAKDRGRDCCVGPHDNYEG